jgi:hypothetical protein
MKFLKQKNISKFNITDQTLFANQYGRAVMNLTGGLRLPKGNTNQRPQGTNIGDDEVRTLNGADGFIRYNTDTNLIEAYIDGGWVTVRAGAGSTITKQTLGPGDDIETIFGPLAKDPVQDDNIIVLVENVMQISETNFEILYNYQGSGDAYIEFKSPVPLDKDITIYFGYSN